MKSLIPLILIPLLFGCSQPSPEDAYISQMEEAFGQPVTDRAAVINLSYETCASLEMLTAPGYYPLAVSSYVEGANLSMDDAEDALKAQAEFACPKTWDRIQEMIGK